MATETLRPNAPGDLTQLDPYPVTLPNWDCVNDEVADDDATYVSAPEATGRDLYNLPDTAIPDGSTINSVTVVTRMCRDGTLSVTGYAVIKIGGTEYIGALRTLGTSWTTYSDSWATNPYTGNPWTKTDINALQAGVNLGYDSRHGNYGIGMCTQVYVIVDYTPPTVAAKKPIMDGLILV